MPVERHNKHMGPYPVRTTRGLGLTTLAATILSAAMFLLFSVMGVEKGAAALTWSVAAFMSHLIIIGSSIIFTFFPTTPRFSLGFLPTIMSVVISAAAIGGISLDLDGLPKKGLGIPTKDLFVVCIILFSISSVLQAGFFTFLITCRYWFSRENGGQNTVYGNGIPKSTSTFGSSLFNQQNQSVMRVPPAALAPGISIPLAANTATPPSLPPLPSTQTIQDELEDLAWLEAENAAFYATPALPLEDIFTDGLGIQNVRPRMAESIIAHMGEDGLSVNDTEASFDEFTSSSSKRDTYYPSPKQLNLSPVTRFSMLYKPVRHSVILRYNQTYPEERIAPGEPNVHPAIMKHPKRDEFGSLDDIEAAGVDLTLTKSTVHVRFVEPNSPPAVVQHRQRSGESSCPPQRAVRPVAQEVNYIAVPNFRFGGKPVVEEK
ncbi:hypothetical protein DFH27DRAFT_347180 [Peziza echinospora]|nr:hypothetical protein DFH27DRAFT_347180 [Peziza echinospora]